MDHYHFSVGIHSLPVHGELSVLFSGHGRPLPKHQVGPAVHNYYLVHTILSGRGTYQTNNQTYTLGAGDTFVIFPETLFTYTSDEHDPWTYRWVAFRGDSADSWIQQLGFSPAHPFVQLTKTSFIKRLYQQMEQTLKQQSNVELADLEVSGLLRLLLKELGEANADKLTLPAASSEPDIDRQIKQAIRWMSLQYADQISIESLSRTLGYHRTHLSKMFKQATGYSPAQFLLRVRMERARELLDSQPHLLIDQVASSVGYNDALHFSRQFHKLVGCSPTAYRHRQRETPAPP
ncbi:AraC-like DNA-binding protein [Paenibacillus phyllosphaerae]|uniref:AraC-like DNA-binding protein n=1 Tax=Paenibacillus phyllosphaerae TaxID=274593 RepID=A0A7W5AW96_9BACL|nr:AraC family transcriptional regulator [Paenibacillus phyllosphaerae]MBB3109837.1 AraC-like DNA-binding protein [Paenibacillus phyllosphaerae]